MRIMLHAESVKHRKDVVTMLSPNVILQRLHNVVETLSKTDICLTNMHNEDYLDQSDMENYLTE